jgi:hypothetical protein
MQQPQCSGSTDKRKASRQTISVLTHGSWGVGAHATALRPLDATTQDPAPVPGATFRRQDPRQEPSAVVLLARICAGGSPNPSRGEGCPYCNHFFDACDLVHLKYEMVRGEQTDGASVASHSKRPSVPVAARLFQPRSSR